VNSNGEFYATTKLPFVMGTTGGDREKLLVDVNIAKSYAVIAPNMGKQIVAMQAALEDLATKYPSAFEGYALDVIESHQKTKADTSGTAKAVIDSLKVLSANEKFVADDDVVKLRTDEESSLFGVPVSAMNGHAWHTYTLTSPDESVVFKLEHNVNGRRVYAEGTADAAAFLAQRIEKDGDAQRFTQ
jgi:4-hydroxy-tetrahydrodipicolinate reductase